jgi:hypothetical protein
MTKLIVAIAVVLALAVTGALAYTWASLSDVSMSVAGYIALIAGSLLTLAVGAGLMFLMYYSNRAGFDDQPQLRVGDAEHGQQRPAGKA